MAKLPKGHPGKWSAKWDGNDLPCVHLHWTEGTWPEYVDPGVSDNPKWDAFINALIEGEKAILTTSYPVDKSGKRRRKSYVGIWSVSNVRVLAGQGDCRELRFTFEGEPLVRF
jgi:hypothetical protein